MEVGEKYARLTVLELFRDGSRKMARCACDCGAIVVTRQEGLASGHSKSCGCLKRDVQRKRMVERNSTHGKSKTRLYNIWAGIKSRCDNPNTEAYKHYGGRGIRYADEWAEFENFESWAVRSGYREDLTIDRVDNDGGYFPDNCRWVPHAEQMKNRRGVRLLTFNGETKCLADWARDTGIRRETIAMRIDDLGWSVEDALTKEVVRA